MGWLGGASFLGRIFGTKRIQEERLALMKRVYEKQNSGKPMPPEELARRKRELGIK